MDSTGRIRPGVCGGSRSGCMARGSADQAAPNGPPATYAVVARRKGDTERLARSGLGVKRAFERGRGNGAGAHGRGRGAGLREWPGGWAHVAGGMRECRPGGGLRPAPTERERVSRGAGGTPGAQREEALRAARAPERGPPFGWWRCDPGDQAARAAERPTMRPGHVGGDLHQAGDRRHGDRRAATSGPVGGRTLAPSPLPIGRRWGPFGAYGAVGDLDGVRRPWRARSGSGNHWPLRDLTASSARQSFADSARWRHGGLAAICDC